MDLFIIVLILDAVNFAGDLLSHSVMIVQLALFFFDKAILVDLREKLFFYGFLFQIRALFR